MQFPAVQLRLNVSRSIEIIIELSENELTVKG
jgi:hypothetical protein